MMFTGTTQQQDTRFSDKEKKLMKQMKFGDCLNKRVDMSKVKLDVLRPWISKKITDILHMEDDVVVEFVYNQLEEEKFPCPKKMQINMTGFLNGRNARQFMGELWTLLLSAQESESGIPAEFIQQKKDEILRRDEEQKVEQQSRYHERSRSHDKDTDRDRKESFISSNSGRSKESNSQKERDYQMPTTNASSSIEHVKSQFSGKSRSASVEDTNLVSSTIKEIPSLEILNATETESSIGVNSRAAQISEVASASDDISIKSRCSPTSDKRRKSSRDMEKVRCSHSPGKRGSEDRKRRGTRSRERSGRSGYKRQSSYRESYSSSPQKRTNNTKAKRRSVEVNGHQDENKRKGGYQESDREKSSAIKRKGKRSTSRSHSSDSHTSEDKDPKARYRSRSVSKNLKNSRSRLSRSSTRSTSRDLKQRMPRSNSRQASISLSPENRKDDFELRRNKNSVQKKRHYRNNRDSSVSSADRDLGRRISDNRRRDQPLRRHLSRGRSPQRIEVRNQRSGSWRRSRSRKRSWSRNRSRSARRSRSPRRYNRRRSPLQFFRGGRGGGHNRGRMNHWRRSPSPRSRGSGAGGGIGGGSGRFERRYSPQRRYSRERRLHSPIQNQFRRFSPTSRRFSPQQGHQQRRSRERRPNSRDRRISALRATSRDRDAGGSNFGNRWDQPPSKSSQRPKQHPHSSSESSNWEEEIPKKAVKQSSISRQISPINNNGKRDRSKSYSRESSPNAKQNSKIRESMGRSSVEYSGPLVKTINLCKEENIEVRKEIPHGLEAKPVAANSARSQRKEIPRDRYSTSLSRTPSPFLKPHEREKIQKAATLANTQLGIQKTQKTPNAITTALVMSKQCQKESDSSSSDSSGESDDSEIETAGLKGKLPVNKKRNSSKGHKSDSSSADNDTNDTNDDNDDGKKRLLKTTVNVKASKNTNQVHTKLNRKELWEKIVPSEAIEKRNNSNSDIRSEPRDVGESRKKMRSSLDSAAVKDSSILKKPVTVCGEHTERNKTDLSNDKLEEDAKVSEIKSSKQHPYSHKRTASVSVSKKQRRDISSDSEEDHMSKKKRKKTKKLSKRMSNSEEENSSDSQEDPSPKKKKHKKHKKHSKKSKKHKKHKKKSKKAEGSSSSEEDEEVSGLSGSKTSMSSMNLGGVGGGGINEDLEKQLRERALKSMKKLD